MKKILILTAVAGLGYFSSYSQTATATRHIEDPNAPQKVAETKKANSIETEREARIRKDRESKMSSSTKTEMTEPQKLKLEREYNQKNPSKTEINKSAKSTEASLTPVKKN